LYIASTPASSGGVTVNVTVLEVPSAIAATGLEAASAVQPLGSVSAAVPAASAPPPALRFSVTPNEVPGVLKKREKLRYSSVPSGSPVAVVFVAP
jgi:hypothetical protein